VDQSVYTDEAQAYSQVSALVASVSAKNGWTPSELSDVQDDVDAAHQAAVDGGFWSLTGMATALMSPSVLWDGDPNAADPDVFWSEVRTASEAWDLPGADDLRATFGAAAVVQDDNAAQAKLASPLGQVSGAVAGTAADLGTIATNAKATVTSSWFWPLVGAAAVVILVVAVGAKK